MKYAELNQKGNFDPWDQKRLVELLTLKAGESSDEDYLIYQNERMKLSIFVMEPYERIPFRVFKNDFNLVCLTGGVLVSRYSHGGISLVLFEKGESVKYQVKNTSMIHDFQNVGENLLVLASVEYVHSPGQAEIPFHFSETYPSLFSKN